MASPQNCRAAVALNNMGVTLLERCRFREARKNFRDGLSLMKGFTDDLGRKESLRRSAQCLAKAAFSPGSTTAKFELTALTHDDSCTCTMMVALHEFQSSSACFVMRLDWNDDEEDKEDAEVYYTATMLYNYSAACRMHSLACKSKGKAHMLQTLATKSAVSARETLKDVTSERNLTLLLLDLQQLMQLAASEGDKDKACEYYCELALLRTQLEDYQHKVSMLFKSEGRMAAAA